MATTTTHTQQLAHLVNTGLHWMKQARDLQQQGRDRDAANFYIETADVIADAASLAGEHGLDMPAELEGEQELVDLFQEVASTVYEQYHPHGLH